MHKLFAISILALAFLAAGCGSSPPSTKIGYDYKVETITYEGKPLNCLVKRGSGYGKRSGISCDWISYHELEEHSARIENKLDKLREDFDATR